MALVTCPQPADLERLFLGGLPTAQVEVLEEHVLQCGSCLAKLKHLFSAKETLAGVLREKTHSDAPGSNAAIDDLIKRLDALRPAPPNPRQRETPMIAFTCSACQKKLSVKEEQAGKKVKCPACGAVMAVPVPVPAGIQELRTLPPEASSQAPPSPAGNPATDPSLSKPDNTFSNETPDNRHDSSLTDFLAPKQADGELGRLGKYRILKILGHGGMGVVYQAEDLKLKRAVAIKAMLPTLAASASAGKRFLREAEAMAAVEHDHIVRIYQIDEERGIPFMAMEFLKGETLDARLKRDQQLPLAEVLRIGREIAEALAAAHATGLIHRDIKPANVWLETPKNRVKILDFGLARAAAQESGLTQQGAIIGTPAYMSPEQARGDNVDARCDLFSLGVVLYRMSTGKQAFVGKDTVSTLMEVAMHAPPPPVMVNFELPQELSDLVMKLLEKDTAKRMASAAEVVAALQSMEDELRRQKALEEKTQAVSFVAPKKSGRAEPRKGPGEGAGAEGAPRRRPLGLVAVALAAVFGILVLGAGGIVYYWQTNNGVVRIEINDPDIKITFDKTSQTITGVDKKEIKLTPGEHGLHIQRGDLEFDTDKFILKRGETITLKIEWFKDGKLQVVQGNQVIGAKELPKVDVAAKTPAAAFALQFDGKSSYVHFPTLERNALEPATIEAWVRAQSKDVAMLVRITGKAPCQVFFDSGISGIEITPTNDFYRRVRSESTMDGKAWVHVAYVVAKDETRIFINGQLDGRTKGKFPEMFNPAQANGAWLGANPKLGHLLNGRMAGLRVSKSARYDNDFTPAKRFEPDADTLALYHFDEGAGEVLKDSSGNNHHGKIVGAKWVKADGTPIGPPPTSDGLPGLEFDGKSYVEIPSLKRDDVGPYTLETWVRPTNLNRTMMFLRVRGNVKTMLVSETKYFVAASDPHRLATGDIAVQNQWTHLALVTDDKEARLYVDGKIKASCKIGENPAVADKLLSRFGMESDGGAPMMGTLREIRVSKVARYDKDFTPAKRHESDADTLALYHFDEGSGDKLTDSSGNNHHGKIVGAKWVKAEGTQPVAAADTDRRGAEYVLSLGGYVRVNGGDHDIKAAAELPKERFTLTGVLLGWHKVTEAGLANLKDCKGLTHVDLSSTGAGVSDDGLANLRGCTNLEYLNIGGTNVTDAGLAFFKECKKLKFLAVAWSAITDAGLANFKDCKGLTSLYLNDTAVADAGLAHFKDCKGLTGLSLHNTKVTDAGLAQLKDCTGPLQLSLNATAVTDVGLAHFKDCKGLTSLSLGDTAVTDAGLAQLKGCIGLTALYLNGTKVTDAGLAQLKDCKGLTILNVRKTQVTAKGLEAFHAAVPGCRIEDDGGVIEPIVPPGATPVDVAWLKLVAAMPVDKQLEAVGAELMKRNADFDGKVALHPNNPRSVMLAADNLIDISPLRALTWMNSLFLQVKVPGKAKLADLSPLKDMKLVELGLAGTNVSDLSPLKGVPLSYLNCGFTPLADLSPLKDMKVTALYINDTKVSDLSPLRNMPLELLYCDFKFDRDAEMLRSITTLKRINDKPAAEVLSDTSPPVGKPAPAYGLRFAGGDSVKLPPLTTPPTSPVTVEMYVDLGPSTNGDGGTLLEVPSGSLSLGVWGGWGQLWFFVGGDLLKTGGNPLKPGMTHVAAVRTTDELRIFVNGKRIAAMKRTKPADDKGDPLLGRAFAGMMREVRISSSARYDKDFTPQQRFEPDKDTIALYHCDDGQGDKLTDSSPNGRHGKIVGAKWVKAAAAPIPAFTNTLGMEFVVVPKGKAWLGGGNGKEGTNEVNIPQDFYLGVYEVTQEDWQKVTGKNPSHFSRSKVGKDVSDADLSRFPVENISWEDAREFVKLVNEQVKKDGKEVGWEYRLPTEEQWEYACRGGPMADKAESAFDFYIEKPANTLSKEQANFQDSGLRRPRKVGSYPPNRLGLHDMHGNVWEICDPKGDDLSRMWRGGSWDYAAAFCRAANRSGGGRSDRENHLGMRLARVPIGKAAS